MTRLPGPMCSCDDPHQLHVAVGVLAEAHLHVAEPVRQRVVEVVRVPVGRLLEHRRAGAVERDAVDAAAEQCEIGTPCTLPAMSQSAISTAPITWLDRPSQPR